jgi:hypothetical protein
MASQLVLWTAIPNGIGADGKLRVSVHVAPRLTPSDSPGSLAEFPDWVDWPTTAISWQVKINGTNYPASVVSTPSEAIWQALFPSTTFVAPSNYQSLTGHKLYSYPTSFVRNFFFSTYSALAAATPQDWPTASYLLGSTPYSKLPIDDDRELSLIGEILAMFPPNGGPIPAGASPNPPLDLLQTKLFLQPLSIPPAGSVYPLPRPTPPDLDFHQAVGLLGRHPALLRTFALTYDLELPVPSGSFPSRFRIQAVPTWTPKILSSPYSGTSTDVTPFVHVTWPTWLPAPRVTNPELNGGYLRLSDSEYGTIELDLDGATLKALDFVKNVERATGPMKSADTPTNYAVPALRSAGLSLARTANAAALYGALQTGDANNSLAVTTPPGVISLVAEDVTQGYRIDAWDSVRNQWFQLCARSAAKPGPGAYVIGTPGQRVPVPAGDEGWVELGVTSAGDPTTSDQFLPETLLRWSGWSLVAPRPGSFLSYDPHKGLQKDTHNLPTGAFLIQIDYAATAGTLPVLRFGRSYRFRARAVDMAGNSVPFSPTADAASFSWATPTAFYGRMEPVATPFVVPTGPRTPGEHLERIVIRSNYDIPDSDPSILHSARHIVPPVTSVEMADQHGALDTSDGVPNVALYAQLASLDGLTYTTPSVVSSLGGAFDTQPMNNGIQWIYYDVAELGVPYMPDVFARGATLQGLPGVLATSPVPQIPFGSQAWPTVHGFKLDVGPGSGAPTTPSSGNSFTLSVLVPKATFQTVRLSSYFRSSDLNSMGLWSWLKSAGEATPALRQIILNGEHWMFTPYRELVIVHAVRQPLLPPQFTTLSQSRSLGGTFALLTGAISCDPPSTSRLDIVSSWTEPFDDGSSATGSVELAGNARVGELDVAPADPATEPFANLRHDFGDTKHRNVYYEARATTAFLEYFTETAEATLTGTTPSLVDASGFASGTVLVNGTGTAAGSVFAPDIDYAEDDASGTIARLAGGAIPSGAVVQVQYVTPPVIRSSLESDASPPTPEGNLVSIPSSTRPAAPQVRYLLPAFAWQYSATPTPTSTRGGNILRVYLGRPWWDTGEGELLGVVIADPPPGVQFPSELQPFVTGYGRDPLFVSGAVKPSPALGDFPLAVATGTGLLLAEQSEGVGLVDVAGHAVQWDAGRGLWFSDIEIEAGSSYWPFVKLALVRYQPASISGVEISRVIQADFAQLAPDRVATLTFPTGTSVTVNVVGPSFADSNLIGSGAPPDMRAWVESQIPGVTDPDLGWQITPAGDPGTVLTPTAEPGSITSWTGTVTLPAMRGSQPFRILIGEREQFPLLETGNETLRTTYLDTIEI